MTFDPQTQLSAPKRRRKRKSFRFYYLCATGTALALIALLLGLLWLVLADYQDQLPAQQSDLVLHALQNKDTAFLYQTCTNLPPELQDETAFAAYLNAHLKPTELYSYQENAENGYSYPIMNGQQCVGRAQVSPTGGKSRFGFAQYRLDGFTLEPLVTYTVTAPEQVALLLGGEPLSEQYLTAENPVTNGYAQVDGMEEFTQKIYTVTDLHDLSALQAESTTGVAQISYTDNAVSVTCVPENAVAAELAAFAQQFSERYLVFATAYLGARQPVLSLCLPGTDFYDAVRVYGNSWGEEYVSDRYENLRIDALTQYSETAFSCEVAVEYVIRQADGQEKTYPFHARLFVLRQADGLKVANVEFLS